MGTSLYIHIPFCRRKCPYCDFYSIIYQEKLAREYINIISEEISKLNISFDTVYIGGGTPTVISVGLWKRLLDSLKRILRNSCENTIEANPESLSREKLKLFLEYNINRISIGLQSLSDNKLKSLGRIHNAERGIKAVMDAKKCGFSNISIDLIYGCFNEVFNSWEKELTKAIELPITHISCYALNCEPNTDFYRLKENIDDKEVAKMYIFNMRFLPKNGYKQYEVSNFALDGFECRHNLKYWNGSSYLGIGAGAVSYIDGVRKKNISDVREYIRKFLLSCSCVESGERLDRKKSAKELAALKIRTKEGIDFDWFKKTTGFDFLSIENREVIEKFRKRGLIRFYKKGGILKKIAVTKKGYLFCDEVSSYFV